ncbi:MAG TPA: polyphosphate polymerase domain-containing protein [Clostridiales bacterium]|nr:polyphosphate polymerase domain-containing protein [Clostridiales bacterium]
MEIKRSQRYGHDYKTGYSQRYGHDHDIGYGRRYRHGLKTKQDQRFRHELKYYINHHQYITLRNRLSYILRGDPHADGDNEYHIRSLYFDDIYNTGLFDKQAGVNDRKKFRIRIYNYDDGLIKLEKKTKVGQFINKQSVSITKEEFYRIMDNDIDFLYYSDKRLLREFYIELTTNLLRPLLLVDYTREAYIHPANNIRITFDKNLRTSITSTDIFNKDIFTLRALDEPLMIMEIKYNNFFPDFIRNMMQISVGMRTAASKYVICRKFFKTNNWEDH